MRRIKCPEKNITNYFNFVIKLTILLLTKYRTFDKNNNKKFIPIFQNLFPSHQKFL